MLDQEASAFLMPLRALAREGQFAAIAMLIGDGKHWSAVIARDAANVRRLP